MVAADLKLTDARSRKKKDSLSQEVYREILARLMDNRLVPGTMLNRRDVAKELGVSVAPVLEAMLQLEIEGFLESVPRKGSFVKPIKQEDIYGQLMVREALECQGARLYCGKPIRDHKDSLINAAAELDGMQLGSIEGWEGEIHFHLSLIDLAHCEPLSQTFVRTMQLGLFYQMNHILSLQVHPENKHFDLIESLSEA
ncbi:MAG: GntR family transcriptional regulator, partial [Treponema sp.]|nr:GntR family transcriptional regulator [Treponema sp.]